MLRKKATRIQGKLLKGNVRNILVSGHSLGGALAALCAYDISKKYDQKVGKKVKLVTFSAPRPGSMKFAQEMYKTVKDHIKHFRMVT